MRLIKKYLNLPADEKKLLAEAFLTIAIVRLGLWILPFRFLKRGFSRILKKKPIREEIDWEKIEKISRSVQRGSSCIPRASCLTQALSTFCLLQAVGQNSDLKIGVAKDGKAQFIAHAWLEIAGRTVIGKSPYRKYQILASPGKPDYE